MPCMHSVPSLAMGKPARGNPGPQSRGSGFALTFPPGRNEKDIPIILKYYKPDGPQRHSYDENTNNMIFHFIAFQLSVHRLHDIFYMSSRAAVSSCMHLAAGDGRHSGADILRLCMA